MSENASNPIAASTPAQTPAQPSPEEALARKEKAFRAQQQKFQTEKQQFETQRKKYETDYVPKAQFKDRWLDMLQEQGLTQEQIAQHLISTPQDPQTKAIMAKIKALEDSQLNATKQAEERELLQFDEVKKQMGADIQQLIATNTSFETMKATPGAEQAVLELIIEDFEKTGILKDADLACAEYEEWLVEETYKLAQLPKVQAKLQPKPPEATTATVAVQNAEKPKWTSGAASKVTVTPQVKTLSNTQQTAVSGKSTEKQRIERALAAFKGQPIS